MKDPNLRTTVIGSYPLPGWYEYAFSNISSFGEYDRNELINDAVSTVIRDQITAGLDVITDGEMSRRDFNLSFYSLIEGLEKESKNKRCFGPPAHDQRGKYKIIGQLNAPNGLGIVADFERLKKLSPVNHPILKTSIPGPYTLSGRIIPNKEHSDRYKITESLLPFVRRELEQLIKAGCKEITIDEPSMSCYAYRENPVKFVDIFNPFKGHRHLFSCILFVGCSCVHAKNSLDDLFCVFGSGNRMNGDPRFVDHRRLCRK